MQEKSYIMLVGENPENFPELGKLAHELGMVFLHASSGNYIFDHCKGKVVALIASDYDSEEFDCLELIGKLRSEPLTQNIPIILATKSAQPDLGKIPLDAPLDTVAGFVAEHLLLSRMRLMTDWFLQRKRIEEIEKANQHLNKVNEQMRRYVGNVAHDLRGPLGKLINTSEMLINGVDADAQSDFFEIMAQASRRGFDLVNDILDMEALESGHIQLCFERCDLHEISSQICQEVSHLAREKGIALSNDIEKETLVKVDRKRMMQVIGNLLTNAIKFTPKGGQITLSATAENGHVTAAIADNGVGISKENQERLFLKHEKTSTPGTEGEQGTGFGLPLAQEIMRAHGSSIEVESEPGKGSTFKIRLPRWVRTSR